jgi:hypothetical protein
MGEPVAAGRPTGPAEKPQDERKFIDVYILKAHLAIVNGQTFDYPDPTGNMGARNEEFVKILDELRTEVQRLPDERGIMLPRNRCADFLNRLRQAGRSAYDRIVSQNFREALQIASEHGQKELGLTFRTPSDMPFQWEMLYEGRELHARPVQVRSFWGFRYPIGRAFTIPNQQTPTEFAARDGIFSAIHEGLPCSWSEVEILRAYVQRVKERFDLQALHFRVLDKEFLQGQPPTTANLIERLIADDFRFGIVHLACHCDKPAQGHAHQAQLVFKLKEAPKFDISVKALEEWLEVDSAPGQTGSHFRYEPFVFVNACESATLGYLLETANFPEILLRFRASGVIATACIIPDRFASAFAREFYRQLLGVVEDAPQVVQAGVTSEHQTNPGDVLGKEGEQPGYVLDEQEGDDGIIHPAEPADIVRSNVGEALLRTRRIFLKRYNNPLGLAYGLYSLSNQKLRLKG